MVAKGGGEMNNFPEVVSYMVYGAIILGVVLLMACDSGDDFDAYGNRKERKKGG